MSDFIEKDLTRAVEEKSLAPVDLVVSCGDMAPEYLSFLKDRLNTPLYYVKGNHDIRYRRDNPMGCRDIHARVISFEGLNILGLEGSMWYNGGANQYTESQMKWLIFRLTFTLWRKGPVHMVVTHAPPRHIHDREDRCHMGFGSFVSLIRRYRPGYFVHGHVHEAFSRPEDRVTRFEQTRVVNTCGYTILEV